MELIETYTDLTTTPEHVLGEQIGLGPEGRQIRARHGKRPRALGPAAAPPRPLTGMKRTTLFDDSTGRLQAEEILTVVAKRTARTARTWREHCER